MHYLIKEQEVRGEFNTVNKCHAEKKRLNVGSLGAKHEYDLYEEGKYIAGISTSPWKNKPKDSKKPTNNTGGQDRAAAEILWLSIWDGDEKRMHILTDDEMAKNIFAKFSGAPLRKEVTIIHYSLCNKIFTKIGILGKSNNKIKPEQP